MVLVLLASRHHIFPIDYHKEIHYLYCVDKLKLILTTTSLSAI